MVVTEFIVAGKTTDLNCLQFENILDIFVTPVREVGRFTVCKEEQPENALCIVVKEF